MIIQRPFTIARIVSRNLQTSQPTVLPQSTSQTKQRSAGKTFTHGGEKVRFLSSKTEIGSPYRLYNSINWQEPLDLSATENKAFVGLDKFGHISGDQI
jgi:hypothetical protein